MAGASGRLFAVRREDSWAGDELLRQPKMPTRATMRIVVRAMAIPIRAVGNGVYAHGRYRLGRRCGLSGLCRLCVIVNLDKARD
jgi:hypothetical protein